MIKKITALIFKKLEIVWGCFPICPEMLCQHRLCLLWVERAAHGSAVRTQSPVRSSFRLRLPHRVAGPDGGSCSAGVLHSGARTFIGTSTSKATPLGKLLTAKL